MSGSIRLYVANAEYLGDPALNGTNMSPEIGYLFVQTSIALVIAVTF